MLTQKRLKEVLHCNYDAWVSTGISIIMVLMMAGCAQPPQALQEALTDQRAHFTYMSDLEQFGVQDAVPEESELNIDNVIGDCDDAAVSMRKRLRMKGISSRLLICRIPWNNTMHMVVLTDDRWILDNRFSMVKRLDDVDYECLFISTTSGSPNDNKLWRKIKKGER